VTVALAAPHPAAVEAGRAAIAAGGGAIDAALAAAAALTVVYPHQCSIGGDLIAIVRPAGGSPRAVLSVGAAARAIDVPTLLAGGATQMPAGGPLTVTVPGVVAGWAAIAALGARLSWADRLAPAITLAREGAEVSPGLARAIRARRAAIDADPGLKALFGAGLSALDNRAVAQRDAPATGTAARGTAGTRTASADAGTAGAHATSASADAGTAGAHATSTGVGAAGVVGLLVQPALADSLAALARDWRTFYRGDLGHRLVAGLRRLGSPLSAADFAAHRAEVAEPLTGHAHGAAWSAAPPPSQGATLLAVLGSDRPLTDARRAQLARDALLGDPRIGPIDLAGLLLGAPAPDTVPAGPPATGDTVAVTAVGSDGTAVSLIQSVFDSFGAGLLEPDTGIVLHNRGSMFRLEPDHPGRIAPGARPPHTLCPAVAVADDTVLALGCQGGRSQPWILAQLAADALTSADPAAVVRRPRWIIGGKPGHGRPALVLEPGVPGAGALAAEAAALGLAVTTTGGPHDGAGHVQLARLRGGTLSAASDPRADGTAAVR
jgi:oxamate amidohydrolase